MELPADAASHGNAGDGSELGGSSPSKPLVPIPKEQLRSSATAGTPFQQLDAGLQDVAGVLQSVAIQAQQYQEENVSFKQVIMHREYEERLQEIDAQVKKSMAALRAQNETLALQLSQKVEEVQILSAQRDACQEELQLERKEVDVKISQMKAVLSAKDDIEAHKNLLRADLDRMTEELVELRPLRDDLAREKEGKTRKEEELERKIRELGDTEKELRALRTTNRELSEDKARKLQEDAVRIEGMEAELKVLRKEKEQLETMRVDFSESRSKQWMAEAETSAKHKQVVELSKELEKVMSDRDEERKQWGTLNDAFVETKTKLASTLAENTQHVAKVEEAKAQVKALREERDALLVSLSAALKKAEDAEAQGQENRREELEKSREREREMQDTVKELSDKVTVMAADIVNRDKVHADNEALRKTITSLQESLSNQVSTETHHVVTVEGKAFSQIDRIEKLEDENQLLQRISGMQETMSRLNATVDHDLMSDATEFAPPRSVFGRAVTPEHPFLGAYDDRDTTIPVQDQSFQIQGNQLHYSMQSDSSTILAEEERTRASVNNRQSGLKWEHWTPSFDLGMSSYYLDRTQDQPPSPFKDPAPPTVPTTSNLSTSHVQTSPRPSYRPAPSKPPPPNPEPPLNDSSRQGSYLTPGLPLTNNLARPT